MTDWLGEDQAAREEDRAKAVDFAKLYEVFVQDLRGKALLAHWVDSVEQRDIPPAASHAEYAYWEGRRAFIRGIQRQIALASTEGRVPK